VTEERAERERWVLPLCSLILLVGLVWILYIVAETPAEVFYSGDGGLKYHMTRQLASGVRSASLEIVTPDWGQALPDDDLFPTLPPFVQPIDGRAYPGFPWIFPALSVPGYLLAGPKGVLLLPALSLLPLWALTLLVSRRLGLDGAETCLVLATLVLGLPLTIHAGLFWEHAPAAALAGFGALGILLPARAIPSGLRGVPAGLALGGTFWLRPEAAAFTSGVYLVAVAWRWRDPEGRWALGRALVATAAMVAAYLALNVHLYGTWLGAHGLQMSEGLSPLVRVSEGFGRGRDMVALWFDSIPVTWVVLLLFGLATRKGAGDARGLTLRLAWVLPVFLVLTACMVPNDGGKQVGPRYLLLAATPFSLLLGASLAALRAAGWRRTRVAAVVALVALLGLTSYRNVVKVTGGVVDDLRLRIYPTLTAIRARPGLPVIVSHMFIGLELAALWNERPTVMAHDHFAYQRVLQELEERNQDVLVVDFVFAGRWSKQGLEGRGWDVETFGATSWMEAYQATFRAGPTAEVDEPVR
jgi:hypothetical protein